MTIETTPTDSVSLAEQSVSLLHRFLALVDPPSAALLPKSSAPLSDADPADNLPIDQWTLLHASTAPAPIKGTSSAASISVRSHPSPNHNLFAVQSVLPGVTARQFWTLMANSCNRDLWDGAVEEMEVKRWLAKELAEGQMGTSSDEQQREVAEAICARVEFLRFGSIFMVAKPRDMVLLSVDARLPSNESTAIAADPPLRLVSACTSVPDPSIPPKKGFMRFHLAIGGFMVEDLGSDVFDVFPAASGSEISSPARSPGNSLKRGLKGLSKGGSLKRRGTAASLDELSPAAIRITQVSDLGEMASWLPQSIVRMVAQTLVPRSMATIAKITAKMQIPEALKPGYEVDPARAGEVEKLGGAGGEWAYDRPLPPMLGQGILKFDEEELPAGVSSTRSKLRASPPATEGSSVHRLSIFLRDDSADADLPVASSSVEVEQVQHVLNEPLIMGIVPEEPVLLSSDDESSGEEDAHAQTAFSSSSSSLDLASSSSFSDAPASSPEQQERVAHGLYGALGGNRFHRATLDLAKLVSSSQPPTPGSVATPGSVMSEDALGVSQEGAEYFDRRKTGQAAPVAPLADQEKQEHLVVSQQLQRLSRAVFGEGDVDHGHRVKDLAAGETSTEQDSVADLLADALGSDVRPARMRSDANLRRSVHAAKRRETQRMSEFILAGSDALAMALAPGARETLRGEGGTGRRRTVLLSYEEVGGLDTMFGTSVSLRDRTTSSTSAATHITESTSGGSTSVTTPGSSSPSIIAEMFSAEGAGSRRPSTASAGSKMSPLVATTVLHAAGYSSSAGTNEQEDEDATGDEVFARTGAPLASRTRGWTASLATAPYSLVLGLVSLAWATRHTSSLGEEARQGGHVAHPKKRNPSTSAVEAARAAVALGTPKANEPNRRKTAPPTNSTSSTLARSNSGSPTTLVFSGLVSGSGTASSKRPTIPADGSAPRLRSRDNYARNNKLHPFPASLGRAAAEGRGPLPDLSPPASPEVMPCGPPLVGALEADARAGAFDLASTQQGQGVHDAAAASSLLTPLRWLGSYMPVSVVASTREKSAAS